MNGSLIYIQIIGKKLMVNVIAEIENNPNGDIDKCLEMILCPQKIAEQIL